jgi:hypothetical protein
VWRLITNVDWARKEDDLIRRLFTQFPGRRRLFAAGIALNTALIAALMSVGGATPAAAASAGTHAVTVWVPLACEIAGVIPSEVAVAVNATIPDSVNPGEVFSLTNSWTVQVFPPASQNAAAAAFSAKAIEGIVSDFENQVTNATTAFTGAGTPTQINQVAALQTPNADGSPWTDPLINGPSPLQAYVEHPPAATKVFSFGPVPSDPSGAAIASSYGPAPGTGGGPTPTSGTPDPIATFGPFTTTGSAGSNIVLTVGDPGTPFNFGGTSLKFAAATQVFFQNKTSNLWSTAVPTSCGVDTTTGAVPPPPGSGYLSAFTIPIVNPGVVPEAPFAVLLPLGGLLVIGALLVYRRRQVTSSEGHDS